MCVKCGLVHLAPQCDARRVKRTVPALLVLFGVACGTSSTSPPPTAQPVPSSASTVEQPDEPVELEPAPIVPPTDRALDEMDASEIEAACMAGSTAACDRLGH